MGIMMRGSGLNWMLAELVLYSLVNGTSPITNRKPKITPRNKEKERQSIISARLEIWV
jgi:hypothetical protein